MELIFIPSGSVGLQESKLLVAVIVSSLFGSNQIQIALIGTAEPVATLGVLLFADATRVLSVGNSVIIFDSSIISALLLNVFLISLITLTLHLLDLTFERLIVLLNA